MSGTRGCPSMDAWIEAVDELRAFVRSILRDMFWFLG